MSRDPYRGSAPDVGYLPRSQRWDADRLVFEGSRREPRYEERETRITRARPREHSVDYIDDRRSSRGGYEEERIREREYDFAPAPEEQRYAIPMRPRKQSVTIERERDREYYEEPPRRAPVRPGLLRRQSSLDTFDRRPVFPPREEYGPPVRYRPEPVYAPAPLPRPRPLGPPRGYRERDYEEIRIAEPDRYGDEDYHPFPERIREREVVRTRRRSRSRESHVRSHSSSSGGSTTVSVKPEFPKRGKTRMPARLVSIKAVIDLGYPYEQEGETIIIQKALGRENIDEVIKLSEDYRKPAPEIIEMSGGRSSAGDVVEERHEVIQTDAPGVHETVEKTTIERRETSPARSTVSRSRSVGRSPHIVDAHPTFVQETSAPIVVGPLVLADTHNHRKDERAIRAEIRALEAEKEALKAEKRANKELRRADRLRAGGREVSGGEVVLFEETTTRYREPETVVRIEKDKKGPDPRALKLLMKTLT